MLAYFYAEKIWSTNAPVKLFCPSPPPHTHTHTYPREPPRISLFWRFPQSLITSFLPCPALINHFNPLILECPALFSLHFPVPRPFFITQIFPLTPGLPVGDGGRTIRPAHNKVNYCVIYFTDQLDLSYHSKFDTISM